jgi:TolA-binding protein
MEKSHTVFLQDFRTELQQLKDRIQDLEKRLEALENEEESVPAEEAAVDFTGVEIGVPEESVETPEPLAYVPEPPAAEEPAAEEPAAKEPVPQPAAPEPLPVDEETAHLTWRTDKPGLPVKNIRSGISLLDRALFIGTLFKEDYALYDQTISRLNECASLEEAVKYIKENFPQWNLRSDVVYHFMMAIRKKLG